MGGGGGLSRVGRHGTLTGSRFPHPDFPHAEEGNIFMFGFAPLIHGVMKILLSYEVC